MSVAMLALSSSNIYAAGYGYGHTPAPTSLAISDSAFLPIATGLFITGTAIVLYSAVLKYKVALKA